MNSLIWHSTNFLPLLLHASDQSSLANNAPNTSNSGSGRDQYTNWFRAPRSWRSQRALAERVRERERERGGGGSEREKKMEGEMAIRAACFGCASTANYLYGS